MIEKTDKRELNEKGGKIKMIMSKKGQAAMEFLMTYGWAILIAIIAIAALIAFGVLNPAIQETCGTGGVIVQGITCDPATVVIGQTALGGTIAVINNLDSPIDFSVATITPKANGVTCTMVDPAAIPAGTTGVFTLTCTGLVAGKALDAAFSGGTYTLNGQTYPYTFKLVKKIAN